MEGGPKRGPRREDAYVKHLELTAMTQILDEDDTSAKGADGQGKGKGKGKGKSKVLPAFQWVKIRGSSRHLFSPG